MRQHGDMRDVTASLLKEVSHNVETELSLQLVSVPDRSALFFYYMDGRERSGNIAYQKLCHAHEIVRPIRLQNAWSAHGKREMAGTEL